MILVAHASLITTEKKKWKSLVATRGPWLDPQYQQLKAQLSRRAGRKGERTLSRGGASRQSSNRTREDSGYLMELEATEAAIA